MIKILDDLYTTYDFISNDEIEFISNLDFELTSGPNPYDNVYYRMEFDLNLLPTYKSKIERYIKDKVGINLDDCKIENWLNEITPSSNKDDDFHWDASNITFLTYVNENFIGGELSYKDYDETEFKIKPETKLTLILTNKLLHKVDNVQDGVRYSIVTFIYYPEKKIKSLI